MAGRASRALLDWTAEGGRPYMSTAAQAESLDNAGNSAKVREKLLKFYK